jgi:hypothetical protein
MTIDQQTGTTNIRATLYDKIVKGFATASYKFKQAVTVSTTSAWKNYFYRESPTALTEASGLTASKIKGLSRGAAFPQAVVEWERVLATIQKYGLEDTIPWEDILADDIDVRNRTLFRIAEGVTKAVDDEIWNVLTESVTPTNIQSVTTYACWDYSSAAIIDDLMQAKQKIAEYNYDTANLICFISPKDHRRLIKYLTDKGSQFPTLSADLAQNGNVGRLAGIDFVMSNSVAASHALIVVPRICATWKELVPLQTTTITDPYRSETIRAVEEGITQLTDPKAVVLILNTQSS